MTDQRAFRRNVLYLIAATRGGVMRVKIIMALMQKPLNANMLAEKLGADYKTIRHHLEMLQKNNWIVGTGSRYGGTYSVTFLPEQKEVFEEIASGIGKKL